MISGWPIGGVFGFGDDDFIVVTSFVITVNIVIIVIILNIVITMMTITPI